MIRLAPIAALCSLMLDGEVGRPCVRSGDVDQATDHSLGTVGKAILVVNDI